jgi:hypothetical protein
MYASYVRRVVTPNARIQGMAIVAAIGLPISIEGDRQVDRPVIGANSHVQSPAALLFLEGGDQRIFSLSTVWP